MRFIDTISTYVVADDLILKATVEADVTEAEKKYGKTVRNSSSFSIHG